MTRPVFSMTLALMAVSGPVAAQDVTDLKTFSLRDDPAPQADSKEMQDCLFDPTSCQSSEFRTSRTLSLEDVQNLGVIKREPQKPGETKVATKPAEPLPTIDIEVLFAYDSADLTPQAQVKLASLASALNDPRLAGSTLLFIGHTDAVGSAVYNKALSQRRADAVARYIRQSMQLAPGRIKSIGVGFDDLKTPAFPEAAENRRVQLVLVPDA